MFGEVELGIKVEKLEAELQETTKLWREASAGWADALIRVDELRKELKVGNQLYATLTDKYNDKDYEVSQLRAQFTEKDKIISLLHEANADLDDVCIRLAKAESKAKDYELYATRRQARLDEAEAKMQQYKQLAEKLLNFAQHGDYSNGNVAFGTDEGRSTAWEALKEYERQLVILKAVALEGQGGKE